MRGKGPRGTGCYHRPRVPGPSTLRWALPDPQNSGEAETHLKKNPRDLKDSIVLTGEQGQKSERGCTYVVKGEVAPGENIAIVNV